MRLLDLFCGAGGAALGYRLAGFTDIVGVDIVPQNNYPFEFVQADALEYLAGHGGQFDAIHASPPCQGYSIMHNLPWLRGREYPLLLLPTLEMLEALGKPYVVENVMGARHGSVVLQKRGLEAHGLKAGWLCGAMFGLPFYRHRLFASNWFWLAPGHPKHVGRIRPGRSLSSRARDIVFSSCQRKSAGRDSGGLTQPANSLARWQGNGAQAKGVGIGHAKGWHLAAQAMGIDWMKREEFTQAVPPAYTEFIGWQLLKTVAGSNGSARASRREGPGSEGQRSQ